MSKPSVEACRGCRLEKHGECRGRINAHAEYKTECPCQNCVVKLMCHRSPCETWTDMVKFGEHIKYEFDLKQYGDH